MSEEKLEEWGKSNITCPHCKDVNYDSWEINSQDHETNFQEMKCWNCKKKFLWRRQCEITYDTEEIK